MKITQNEISLHLPRMRPGDRIYLKGDLGSGKTTFVQECIRALQNDPKLIVQSPTYMYCKVYPKKVYHFDLYRLDDYETFVDIGGEEIFDDAEAIIFVEWSEKIENYHLPTQTIFFKKTEDVNVREVRFIPDLP